METINVDSRPQVVEKTTYQPMGKIEEFIVPLLKQHIERFLSTDAKPIRYNQRALDIGCGGQPFRKELEDLGYIYISTDVTQNPEGSVDILSEIDKPISNELLGSGPFDLIFCTEVMEHVVNWDTAFSNFSQLLNVEGKIFITCPHFYPLHEVPYDFWRPTPHALQHFARQHGLTVLQQENAGDAWDIIGTVLAYVYSVPLSRSIRDRLLNKIVSIAINFLFKLLRDRTIQKYIRLESSLYMSNIFLCQKQS